MKIKFIISIVLLLSQNYLHAHNPFQSSLQLSLYEGSVTGILEINLAQYGVEQALVKKYNLDVASIGQIEYKEKIIAYLKDNINIEIDNQQVKIGQGVIKLGSHQTDVKFHIEKIPLNPKKISVYIPCFQENENHVNFFRIVHDRNTARLKLSKEVNYRGTFQIADSDILVNDKIDQPHQMQLLFPIALIGFAFGMSFLYKRMKN